MSDNTSNNAQSLALPQEEVDAFVRAAEEGNNAAIVVFSDRYGADIINKQAAYGREMIALAAAVRYGHQDTVQLLLERGMDVDAADRDGKTALNHAACGWTVENEDIVMLLLENGADTSRQDIWGKTALDLAETNKRGAIISLLRSWPEMQRQREADRQNRRAVESRIEKLKHLRPTKRALKNSANPKPRG